MAETTGVRVGIDIGGTFTDVVVAAPGGVVVRKVLSTPEDFSRAVIEGILGAAGELAISPEQIGEIMHATTVATNAILQRSGAVCALITTEGFRDVLELGRLRMPRLYDVFYDKSPPLIPRRRVFEVRERIDEHGAVIIPLDPLSVAAAINNIVDAGVDSVAVCLLNSYADASHECAVSGALKARAAELGVNLELSLSAEILPQIGEYERTSTAVINAYVKPLVRAYLSAFGARLQSHRIEAPLFIMQCAGAMSTVELASEQPVTLIESGPAAGVLAARSAMTDMEIENAVSFDMGGTSAKASVIEQGEVLKTRDYEVGGTISATTRLTGGGGYPINIPVVDVAEVGAGGGSLAWIDGGGSLRIGPHSAGASPGPACYGLGGDRPTVTDANIVLGYLKPDAIAGGVIRLQPGLAEKVIVEHIATPLGLDLIKAAYGIHLIANSEMMGAIRAVTTQRGRDVREFTLIAFGGCGPVHAAELARSMGIKSVIVPPAPGLFSAVGLLNTDLQFQRGATFYEALAEIDPDKLNRVLEELRSSVAEMAASVPGIDKTPLSVFGLDKTPLSVFGLDKTPLNSADTDNTLVLQTEADLHYQGQSHELTVVLPFKLFTGADLNDLAERFAAEHEQTYSHRAEDGRVVLVAVRVTGAVAGRGRAPNAKPATNNMGAESSPGRRRQAYFGATAGFCEARVLGRAGLGALARPGPLLIEEYDSVTVVPPDCTARLDAGGNIVLSIGGQAEAA